MRTTVPHEALCDALRENVTAHYREFDKKLMQLDIGRKV